MENASKALIIAGAILLAILIIGLGMGIMGQAQDAIGDTGLDQAKINTINSTFKAYEGVKNGQEVRRLIDAVVTHNRTYQNEPDMLIGVTVDSTTTYERSSYDTDVEYSTLSGLSALKTNPVKIGNTYNVSFSEAPNGLIYNVNITKK